MPTYIHTYIHIYMHTYIHTYIYTYIHTHIHIYTHTYIHRSNGYTHAHCSYPGNKTQPPQKLPTPTQTQAQMLTYQLHIHTYINTHTYIHTQVEWLHTRSLLISWQQNTTTTQNANTGSDSDTNAHISAATEGACKTKVYVYNLPSIYHEGMCDHFVKDVSRVVPSGQCESDRTHANLVDLPKGERCVCMCV
jgi:hypothetical protein